MCLLPIEVRRENWISGTGITGSCELLCGILWTKWVFSKSSKYSELGLWPGKARTIENCLGEWLHWPNICYSRSNIFLLGVNYEFLIIVFKAAPCHLPTPHWIHTVLFETDPVLTRGRWLCQKWDRKSNKPISMVK